MITTLDIKIDANIYYNALYNIVMEQTVTFI